MTLRYPYEVRNEKDYFDDIADEKIPKDMLELAQHIVKSKAGHFHPEKFEDQYEDALKELLKKKQAGEKIDAPREPTSAKVVNLMDALRRSVEAEVGVARGGRLNGERQRGIKPQRRRHVRAPVSGRVSCSKTVPPGTRQPHAAFPFRPTEAEKLHEDETGYLGHRRAGRLWRSAGPDPNAQGGEPARSRLTPRNAPAEHDSRPAPGSRHAGRQQALPGNGRPDPCRV